MGVFILRAERYVRQAHNLKVAGSNPAPATKILPLINFLRSGDASRIRFAMKRLLCNKISFALNALKST